jgi:large subunit ribosomal protein L22e
MQKVQLDLSKPVQDGIIDIQEFKKYLQERIKVNGKVGQLTLFSITNTDSTITIQSGNPKRYVKYLTKKYLKKSSLRDWLRCVATPQGYQVRYYNVQQDDEE